MRIKAKHLDKAVLVKSIIEKEYYRVLTLKQLAQMVGTNMVTLQASFKLVANKSLHEYLTIVRIEKAKNLLENTELTVEAIAEKVGLDKTNLHKHFKKITGKTPFEWRSKTENKVNQLDDDGA
jgi:YesN/AraC family two-component response regulator